MASVNNPDNSAQVKCVPKLSDYVKLIAFAFAVNQSVRATDTATMENNLSEKTSSSAVQVKLSSWKLSGKPYRRQQGHNRVFSATDFILRSHDTFGSHL